jgi:hypothetical protein
MFPRMRFEKVWVEQCRATKAIKRSFGAKSALDYLVGEKRSRSPTLPAITPRSPENFRGSWPRSSRRSTSTRSLATVASRPPASRARLRQLLFLR